MQWSPQQDKALVEFRNWFDENRGKPSVFRLFGFAGTGKSTLATHLAQDINGTVSFLAYTGKAAQVLRTKGCPTASTIHSAAYVSKTKSRRKLLDLERQLETAPDPDAYEWLQDKIAEEREQLRQPAFALNAESKLRHSALIVLDEVSMVDRRIGHDLLSFGVPILAMGDPAQLPPVKGSCFVSFERPEVMLTEIHRTALDNPVLYLASRAREGESIDPGHYGESRVCWAKDLDRGVSLQHDQTIVGKNATRRAGNARVRFMLGRTSPFPQEGDRIICLRNDHEAGLLNGMIFETLSCEEDDGTLIVSARPDGGGPDVEFDAHPEVFLGRDLHPWARLDKQEFDYGYVITAHKSQGSEWGRVMVIDESAIFRGERFRWLYTALTRARDSVTLVRK